MFSLDVSKVPAGLSESEHSASRDRNSIFIIRLIHPKRKGALATPARLVKLKCPRCTASHWVVDSDFRGSILLGQRELDYDERTYKCPQCGEIGISFQVQKKTPLALTMRAHWLFKILARHLAPNNAKA